MKDRLYERYNINKQEFLGQEMLDDNEENNFNYKELSGLYTNRSKVHQLDSLANEIFMLFSNIRRFISQEMNEDSLDLSMENRDKVGYLLTSDQLEFGTSIVKGDAISDRIREVKDKNQELLINEMKKRQRVTTSSINMTSTVSNSKVIFLISYFSQAIILNENLVKDNSKRNVTKTKVRAKWIPNEHAEG